jgi:nucleoside-diphosphate-sugar epimerase
MQRRHLVTGATGFIGRYLVSALAETGEPVFVLVRRETFKPEQRPFGAVMDRVTVLYGDVTESNLGLSEPIPSGEGELVIWHLAANLSFATAERARAHRTNVDGTRAVVTFANAVGARLVHMSTAYVCGDHEGMFREVDLELGQRFRSHYEATKYEAERIVRAERSGPTLIIRPSIVIGDAYQGKAEGCTFGYYRWAFMIYLFRAWVKRTLAHGRVGRWLLRVMGTRFDAERGELRVPWLIVPFPRDASVDLVPVDYVIESMMRLAERSDSWDLTTVHLTQAEPTESFTVLSAAIKDFQLVGCRYWRLPNRMFRLVLRCLYYALFPLRGYTKSVYWYLPYVTKRYTFDRGNAQRFGLGDPEPITAERLTIINRYAETEIFARADEQQLKQYLC